MGKKTEKEKERRGAGGRCKFYSDAARASLLSHLFYCSDCLPDTKQF